MEKEQEATRVAAHAAAERKATAARFGFVSDGSTVVSKLGELPQPLADAATAVLVAENYRAADVLASAARLVTHCHHATPPRQYFSWIVADLRLNGAKLLESVIESRRRISLKRSGDSNVVKVCVWNDSTMYARVLAKRELAAEAREAQRGAFERLTRRPIANDNDPAPQWGNWRDTADDEAAGAIRSPALRHRMVMKGRLVELAAMPGARLLRGALVSGCDVEAAALVRMPCRTPG